MSACQKPLFSGFRVGNENETLFYFFFQVRHIRKKISESVEKFARLVNMEYEMISKFTEEFFNVLSLKLLDTLD